MKQTELIQCSKCGKKNRIADPSRVYRCGSCKETLWVPGQTPVDPSAAGNPEMIADCEWVDFDEQAVNVGAATWIRRQIITPLSGIVPRISPRYVLFVLSFASLSALTVSGRFLFAAIFYFVTGALWFAHVETLRASHRPFLVTDRPLFALLFYSLTWPLHAIYFAKEKLRRLTSRERFRVSVGPTLRGNREPDRTFHRWREALEYARKKAAQRGEATIQDTGRDEWSKPLYDIWAKPKASEDEKPYASGVIDSPGIARLLKGIQREGGDHQFARQVLERVLTEHDVPWTYPLYFVESSGTVTRLRRPRG